MLFLELDLLMRLILECMNLLGRLVVVGKLDGGVLVGLVSYFTENFGLIADI